jgi:hypothetical protein
MSSKLLGFASSHKITRSDQFEESFEDFIVKEFIDKGKLHTWVINLQTKNTRKKIHDYKLVIPLNYLAYYLDNQVVRGSGITEGPGAVYLPQEMPPMDEFIQIIQSHFDKFAYSKNGKILSGVRIGDLVEATNGDKVIDLQVVYHKKYQPYPIRLSREQELEIQLMKAERKAADAEDNCHMMLNICGRERAKYTAIIGDQYDRLQFQVERFNKLANIFRKIATDAYAKGEPQDCPVCLDPIALENLQIALCGHNICTVCNSRCSRCPLCRDEY